MRFVKGTASWVYFIATFSGLVYLQTYTSDKDHYAKISSCSCMPSLGGCGGEWLTSKYIYNWTSEELATLGRSQKHANCYVSPMCLAHLPLRPFYCTFLWARSRAPNMSCRSQHWWALWLPYCSFAPIFYCVKLLPHSWAPSVICLQMMMIFLCCLHGNNTVCVDQHANCYRSPLCLGFYCTSFWVRSRSPNMLRCSHHWCSLSPPYLYICAIFYCVNLLPLSWAPSITCMQTMLIFVLMYFNSLVRCLHPLTHEKQAVSSQTETSAFNIQQCEKEL